MLQKRLGRTRVDGGKKSQIINFVVVVVVVVFVLFCFLKNDTSILKQLTSMKKAKITFKF